MLALATFMLVVGARPAIANTWRCGARLVYAGQTTDEVYALCGEPTDQTAFTEYVTVRLSHDVAVTRPVFVEEWRYNPGPKQFQRYLTFRDGTLIEVEEGSYGY